MIGTIWIVVAVTIVAKCIWLTVRIVNRGERWAKWTAVGICSLPVLYVLSMGPACWSVAAPKPTDGSTNQAAITSAVYWPIGYIVWNVPSTALNDALDWWLFLGVRSQDCFYVPADPEANMLITYPKP